MKKITLGVLAFAAGVVLVAGYVSWKESKMKSATIMEIVVYKTKSGVAAEAHRQHGTAVGKVLGTIDGFLGRAFTEGEGGEWVDVVYWRDMNAAKKAMETVQGMNSPEFGAFFSDIDEASIQMRHTAIRARQ